MYGCEKKMIKIEHKCNWKLTNQRKNFVTSKYALLWVCDCGKFKWVDYGNY